MRHERRLNHSTEEDGCCLSVRNWFKQQTHETQRKEKEKKCYLHSNDTRKIQTKRKIQHKQVKDKERQKNSNKKNYFDLQKLRKKISTLTTNAEISFC
jgi:hypothetical protein